MVAQETTSREVNKLHIVIATTGWFDLSQVLWSQNIKGQWEKGALPFPPYRFSLVSTPSQSLLLCIQISLDSKK